MLVYQSCSEKIIVSGFNLSVLDALGNENKLEHFVH